MGCFQVTQQRPVQNLKIKKIDSAIHDFDHTPSPKGHIEKTTYSKENIRNYYVFQKYLGSGGSGKVRLATHKNDPSKIYAIKTILKDKIKTKKFMVRREIEMLKQLDHPNIVKFYEIYSDEQSFHIVMEYCPGGELVKKILSFENYSEKDAASIMKQLFSAVNYMHQHKVCHRDLKPQNVLFGGKDNNELKIIDFGLSTSFKDAQDYYFQSPVGTLLYVAPEVLKENYDESCDIWSLGIIMHILLSGSPPYEFENKRELYDLVSTGKLNFHENIQNVVSQNARDLLMKLLKFEPLERITAEEALKHPWFQSLQNKQRLSILHPKEMNQIAENLMNHWTFDKEHRFQKEVMKVLVNELTEAETEKLKLAFQEFDKNGNGIIDVNNLRSVFKELGYHTSEEQIEEIIKTIDLDQQNHGISYTEFIAAAIDQQKILTKERLQHAFEKFTKHKDDEFFELKDMKKYLAKKGVLLSEETVKKMIDEIDLNHDGKVTFNQFCKLMNAGGLCATLKTDTNLVNSSDLSVRSQSKNTSQEITVEVKHSAFKNFNKQENDYEVESC